VNETTPGRAEQLAAPSVEARAAFLGLPRTEAAHREAMAGLDCMNRLEAPVGPNGTGELNFPLTVAAWNLERCFFPGPSADLIAEAGADVALLSEVDNGMARTGQRHTTRDIAERLGMNYAYGVEFLELHLGNPVERQFSQDDFNLHGFHGNALLARATLKQPELIRLDQRGHWFRPQSREHRIGGRCAVAATLPVAGGDVLAVSVHLESDADQGYRAGQTAMLLDRVSELAGDLPVIVGGDLNTGVADNADFEKETLWAVAAGCGYTRHGGPIDQMTTRPSLVTRNPSHRYKLDWFLTRGLNVGESRIIAAVGPDGTPLSDHEMVVMRVDGVAD
jgi:endonuclease/exonuclease/phosphatase family metal-dependent hydrolase